MEKNNKKIRNFRLEDTYFKELKKKCKKDNETMSQVIRRLIMQYLAQ
jgi:predicted CopG family antitoxin